MTETSTAREKFCALFAKLLDEENPDTRLSWTNQTAAAKIGVEPTSIGNWRSGKNLPSKANFNAICVMLFGDGNPPARQTLRDLFLAANAEGGSGPSENIDPIGKFLGRFIRLFIKPAVPRGQELAVHLSDFHFQRKSNNEALVSIRSFRSELANYSQDPGQYDTLDPHGILKVTGSKLEMMVTYGTSVPMSQFLGNVTEGFVNSFLLLNLDIKFDTHQVGVQPMLFIKVNADDIFPMTPLPDESELFMALNNYFDLRLHWDNGQFELALVDDPKAQRLEQKVISALKKLGDQQSKTTQR